MAKKKGPANTLASMSRSNILPPPSLEEAPTPSPEEVSPPNSTTTAMIDKVKEEIICEFCGLPNANELKDHPLLDECIICDECNTLALEETRRMEDNVKNIVDHAEIRFRDRVKIKRKICDSCSGEGWVDIP